MEKSRLITRRNRATVNRIFGAFRVRWSHFAGLSKRRARGSFSSIISFNRPEIYFASRLRPSRLSISAGYHAVAHARQPPKPSTRKLDCYSVGDLTAHCEPAKTHGRRAYSMAAGESHLD
jgi:hypothetical protein